MLPTLRAAALSVLGLALLGVASCRPAAPARRCPARFAEDATRAAALVEGLRSTPEGAAILARVPALTATPICFGPAVVSALTTSGVILFDAQLTGPEAAARLGHLLVHVVEGAPLSLSRAPAGDCAAQVDLALAAEARTFALELRLRRALGVSARAAGGLRLPYAFEEPFWAAPPDAREALVLTYLGAHPEGAPGLDALAAGYARRCAEAR